MHNSQFFDNKYFTEYIPQSIYDIHSWIKTPVIFIFDCSNAGHIIETFRKYRRVGHHGLYVVEGKVSGTKFAIVKHFFNF